VSYILNDALPAENRIVVNGTAETSRSGSVLCVPAERLDAVLETHLPSGLAIDLMSVDCEGHDLVVLQSNDFERFRPHVLVVEDHKGAFRSEIDEFSEAREYRLVGLTALSKVFADLRWLAERRGNRARGTAASASSDPPQ
jgi:hypothetical protein